MAYRPTDHDGIPMCSHLVCPRYDSKQNICDAIGSAPPSDLCLPAVSADLAAELITLRVRARKQPDAEAEHLRDMRRSVFARKLGEAATSVRFVAETMCKYEAEHSEAMFDDLREIAAKLERGKELMVTDDEWSWG